MNDTPIKHMRRAFKDRVASGRERMNAVVCERCGRMTWAHEPVDIDRIIGQASQNLSNSIDARIAAEVYGS